MDGVFRKSLIFLLNRSAFLRRSHHMRNVIQTRELIEADVEMAQLREAAQLLHSIQTVAVKAQHLHR